MPDAPIRLELITARTMDSREDPRLILRVEDETSGTVLCHVEMTAGEFWNLATGSVRTVSGFVTGNPERIGRPLQARMLPVPESVARFRGDKDAAEEWASAQGFGTGADVSVRLTNKGWEAIVRTWGAV